MRMRLGIIVLALMMSSMSWAETIQTRNLNFNYVEGKGQGDFSLIQIEGWSREAKNFSLERTNNGYDINIEGEEIKVKNLPSLLSTVKTFQTKQLSLLVNSQVYQTGWSLFKYATSNEDLSIRGLNLNCPNSSPNPDNGMGDRFFDSCMRNGTGRFTQLDSNSYSFYFDKENSVAYTFFTILQRVVQGRFASPTNSSTQVKNFKVNISNHSMKMELKMKGTFGATIKIEGRSSYDMDRQEIVLRIDKAKAGWFNIRNKLFDELSKTPSPAMRVKKPYIYLVLKAE